MENQTIKVIIVDNEAVFREGLNHLLNEQPHIQVVFHCDSSRQAMAKAQEIPPDIIMLESQADENALLEAISTVSRAVPQSRVVIMGRVDADLPAAKALKAGARACLARNILPGDLIKSIELISKGRIIISPVFAESFLAELSGRPSASKPDRLPVSARELDIIKLVVKGLSNRQIAKQLFLTESTIKTHLKNILNKLDLDNRQQLAVTAVVRSWVDTPSV
jgi:DNA-binding NarL/FixJ family response regulator